MRKVQLGDLVALMVRAKDEISFDVSTTHIFYGRILELSDRGIRIAVQEKIEEVSLSLLSTKKPLDWKDFLFEYWEMVGIKRLTEAEELSF